MESIQFQSGLFFWTLVTFAGLLWLLARFAFRPLRTILDERERKIRESIEKADRAKEEAEALLARNESQLQSAREEARRIIGEGHRIVAQMRREAQEGAKREAALIAGQARGEIEQELQRSLDELKSTVANLSVRIARQVIRSKLDEKEHEKLADEFIERLKRSHASRRR